MTKIQRIFILGLISLLTLVAKAQVQTEVPCASAGPAIPEITNLAEIVRNLKVAEFKDRKFTRKIKVAVLDNGFNGYEAEKGKSLPQDTTCHNGKASDADQNPSSSFHGLFMAKLLSQVIAKSGAQADYDLQLFNTYGYTKFADAVDTVIKEQFDVVLYSQVWEYGGNGDGKGFINALVDKATAAGIIWINAAGNFGRLTRVAPVEVKREGSDDWVVFKSAAGKTEKGVTITCQTSEKVQSCDLRLVLAWNDFKDDVQTGTDKDLDLFVLDSKGKQIAASIKNQKLKDDATDPESSKIPRELIETNLSEGTYTVRVKAKSSNFSAAVDVLRLTASGMGISLIDPSVDETLLPPADNPGVILIGASDDIETSKSKKLSLPKVYLKSLAKLKDGSNPFSTSNAAAMAAGVVVLNLGVGVEKTHDAILAKLQLISRAPEAAPPPPPDQTSDGNHEGTIPPPPHRRAPAPRRQAPPSSGTEYDTGSASSGSGGYGYASCLPPARLPFTNAIVQDMILNTGARVVFYNRRVALLVNYDFAYTHGLRPNPFERVFVTPFSIAVFNLQQIAQGLPADYYEVVSSSIAVCGH